MNTATPRAGAGDCERCRPGLISQPVNAVSSLGYVVAGVAMLRGAELGQQFARDDSGRLTAVGQETRLEPGEIEMVSPTLGDIHQVSNAFTDQVSISIHLYGGNIGRISRHVFAPETGAPKEFISGYSNALCPNLWAREAA